MGESDAFKYAWNGQLAGMANLTVMLVQSAKALGVSFISYPVPVEGIKIRQGCEFGPGNISKRVEI